MSKILYIDDDKIDRIAFERFARTENFTHEYETADSLQSGITKLKHFDFDLVVSDYNLGDGIALDLLEFINSAPLVVITGLGNEETAVKALKAGAYDYLIKDSEGNHFKILPITIQNAISRKKAENQVESYKRNLEKMVEERTAELQLSYEKLQNEIIEKKKVSDALKISEERFRLAMDAANDGLWDWDLTNNQIFWSNNCFKMLEYTPNEFAMNLDMWFSLHHPDEKTSIWVNIQNQLKTDHGFEVEFRMKSKSGGWVWIMSRGKPITTDENGNILRIIGTHVDITERKKYEQEIVELNEALEQKVVERTAELNKALERLENSNLELKQLNEAVSRDSQRLLLLNDKLATSEKELQNLNKDLEDKVEERTHELFEAKNKAEEANKIKDIILNNLGHELRTPLNGILGFTNILEKEVTEQLQKEMLQYVKESASRLHQTLNSLLVLTEIETKKIHIYPNDYLLDDLIQLYVNNIHQTIQDKGLELVFEYKSNNVSAYIDEYLIYQIFFNLMDNAIKFTNKGKITIELDREISDKNEKLAVIKIHDTGCGIKETKLDYIFEPFRQGSEGIDRGQEGLGLGLTITRHMVNLLNGKISISSKLGEGTTVTLKFITNDEE